MSGTNVSSYVNQNRAGKNSSLSTLGLHVTLQLSDERESWVWENKEKVSRKKDKNNDRDNEAGKSDEECPVASEK